MAVAAARGNFCDKPDTFTLLGQGSWVLLHACNDCPDLLTFPLWNSEGSSPRSNKPHSLVGIKRPRQLEIVLFQDLDLGGGCWCPKASAGSTESRAGGRNTWNADYTYKGLCTRFHVESVVALLIPTDQRLLWWNTVKGWRLTCSGTSPGLPSRSEPWEGCSRINVKRCTGVNSDGRAQAEKFSLFYKGEKLSIEVLVQFFTPTSNRINCHNKLSLGLFWF